MGDPGAPGAPGATGGAGGPGGGGPGGPGGPAVGSVADEAARLVGLLGDYLGTPSARSDPVGPHADSPCESCPICRGAALLRRVSPEAIGTAADLAGFVATALRDWARWADGQRGGAAPGGTAHRPGATVGHDDDDGAAGGGERKGHE